MSSVTRTNTSGLRLGLSGQLPILVAWAALVSFPASVLTLPALANGCFGLLLAWSLYALARDGRPAVADWLQLARAEWPMMLAMAGLPLALAFRQVLMLHQFPDVPYLYLRLALFALLAWGLLQLGAARIRQVQWGFVAGAFVSAVWIHFAAAEGRPPGMGFFNVIPFGNLSLLMGMLSLVALGWTPRRAWFDAGAKLAAGVAGLYASLLSGTRGGWIAIPVLAVIALSSARGLSRREKIGIVAVTIAGLALVARFSDRVGQRMVDALHGLRQYALPATTDTSVSVRFELWQASLDMFRDHPLTGVGADGFKRALEALGAQQAISPAAAALTHSHNDVLYAMAMFGAPGLVAALAVYLVPGWFFVRHLRADDADIRVAATMGLALCAGFLIFGLTEAMFVITLTNAFYSLVVAACFAIVAAGSRKAPT